MAAVGIAGLAESGAPLRAGRPLAPIIAWHDGRGEETGGLPRAAVRAGVRPVDRTARPNRLVRGQARLAHRSRPAEPDRWLGVPELALFLLTGTEATEHSLAVRTGAYDVTERRFLPDVIAHVRRASACSHRSSPPGSIMGLVTEDGAAVYGLPVGIPVTIAGHDHLAAAAGLGAGPDDLFNSVGTAETLVRLLHTAPDVDRALELDLAVTVWPGGDAWGVLASTARSGLVIAALTAHLGGEPTSLDRLVAADRQVILPAGGPMVDLGRGSRCRPGRPPPCGRRRRRPSPEGRRPPPNGSAPWPGRTAVSWSSAAAAAAPWPGPRSPRWVSRSATSPFTEAAARGAALAAGIAAGWLGAGAPGGDNGRLMTGSTPEGPIEPEMSPEVAARPRACAPAGPRAPAPRGGQGGRHRAVQRRPARDVEVGLPGGRRVTFPVEAGPSGQPSEAVVVKDAGDDPDCTDGARMTATVVRLAHAARASDASPGCGPATASAPSPCPGWASPVGAPAINPVPRRMIRRRWPR